MTREVVWDHGVSLPEHRLWLDPLVVRSFAFISHAHTDHARRHKEALLTPQTLALIPEARVSQAVALVASQDGRFTVFAWSPCEGMVHAHRVETLLL